MLNLELFTVQYQVQYKNGSWSGVITKENIPAQSLEQAQAMIKVGIEYQNIIQVRILK